MTNNRFTQCPHCKASFKVSSEQLAVANGRVRCGACMNIFDAIAYTVANSAEFNQKPAEDLSFDEPPIDLEDALLTQDEDQYTNNGEEPLFEDDPEEDTKDGSYSRGTGLSDELSTSFMELDKNEYVHDPYSTESSEIDEIEAPADESWTQSVLEDAEKIEPHISAYEPETDIPDETFTRERDDNTRENYHALTYAQQDRQPQGRHWLLSSLFVSINLLLLVVLLVQASWFHYEKLAKYPQIASLYEWACDQLKCQLPVLADISKINSHNLIVRSHPTTRKALIIDTIIINNADYPQAFPDIALYFSDINNQTIAQRLIHPQEYLSGELLTWQEMPSGQPIQIAMEILDPGKEAVNYSLAFFSAQTSSIAFGNP